MPGIMTYVFVHSILRFALAALIRAQLKHVTMFQELKIQSLRENIPHASFPPSARPNWMSTNQPRGRAVVVEVGVDQRAPV